jgi:probable phosphoglycerate mutase
MPQHATARELCSGAGVTRIVLIRHGESLCNVNGIVGGHIGCTGLSDTGFRQVEALRDRLLATKELASADVLYSSIMKRAVQTAGVIAPAVGDGSLELIQSCDLCEVHPGDSDGITWSRYVELYGDPNWEADRRSGIAPGEEAWHDFVDRVDAAVTSIADRHSGGLVVIACHGGIVRATVQSFMAQTFKATRDRHTPIRLPTAYSSITEWERDDRGWQLVRYNDVAHLGGPYEAMRDGPHTIRIEPQQS